jgi:hypothetical protein
MEYVIVVGLTYAFYKWLTRPSAMRRGMRTITLTIDENGDQVFLKSDGAEMFRTLGITVTRRASHVEPDTWALRILFHAIRKAVRDTSRVAAWTRTWRCRWRIDASPIGGPILAKRYMNRQEAIEAEIEFVNKFFLGEN